jgi:hypothetical protein
MPDRAVTTDKYRVDLYAGSEKLLFDSDENLSMIVSNMPEWYKEKTKETKKDLKTDLDEALRDLFAKYMDLDRPLIGKPSISQGTVSKRTQGQGLGQAQSKSKGGKGSVQKNHSNPQFVLPDSPQIIEASENDINVHRLKDNFSILISKGGDNGRDLLIYNPNYKSIEKIASLATKNFDPSAYFELAKEKAKEHLILNSALWVMICRSRIAQEKMTLDEFGVSTSSDFLDTYIFARELQVSEDVGRFVKEQWRQDQKQINTDTDIANLETRLVSVGGKIPQMELA